MGGIDQTMKAAMFPGESSGFKELSLFGASGFLDAHDFHPGGDDIDGGDRLGVQMGLYSVCTALWDAMKEAIPFSVVAGHSLGFYGALYAAGAIGRDEGYEIIRYAHSAIEEVSSGIDGGMSAIIGLKTTRVEEICRNIHDVYLANVNSATQSVLSGTCAGLAEAEQAALKDGALSVKRLDVNSPLHSPLMRGVDERMRELLKRIPVSQPGIPIVNHTRPEILTKREDIKDVLCRQFTAQVLWRDAVNFMYGNGIREFVEVGPSDILAKLVKWIQRDASVFTAAEALKPWKIAGKEGVDVQA